MSEQAYLIINQTAIVECPHILSFLCATLKESRRTHLWKKNKQRNPEVLAATGFYSYSIDTCRDIKKFRVN